MKRFLTILCLTSAAWSAVIRPVLSESLLASSQELQQLNKTELPAESAGTLVQLPAPTNPSSQRERQVVEVTVKVNSTEKGVYVILQTTLGEQLTVVNRSAGNSYIADIPNTQLRLPSGEAFGFRSQKLITGITEITVTNFDANTIRVTVTGEASVPTVELFNGSESGLIFGVKSAAVATPPQPQPFEPRSETQRNEPSLLGEEEIEVVVTGEQETGYRVPNTTTGTRTDALLRDIPLSIQVVPPQGATSASKYIQCKDLTELW